MSPTVNQLLSAVTRIERRIAEHVDLPFGLSILLVARVPRLGIDAD